MCHHCVFLFNFIVRTEREQTHTVKSVSSISPKKELGSKNDSASSHLAVPFQQAESDVRKQQGKVFGCDLGPTKLGQ